MSEHDEHSTFIKTPQQLIVVVLLAFLVPIIGIVLLVNLVLNKPSADPAALAPEAVAARLQPIGRVEFGAASGTAAGPRSGEDIVKSACLACHQAGVANAPKVGDKGLWELTARYDTIENKDIVNREATSWLLGVNYYVNPNLRFMFNYTQGDNETNGDETGQYALRTQFGF